LEFKVLHDFPMFPQLGNVLDSFRLPLEQGALKLSIGWTESVGCLTHPISFIILL
jgi:hypothetical protein